MIKLSLQSYRMTLFYEIIKYFLSKHLNISKMKRFQNIELNLIKSL